MPFKKRIVTTDETRWWQAVGNRIKKARKQRGIKQKDFAKMLGAPIPNYCNFENGKGNLNLYVFYQACRILKICANSVMGRKRKQ